MSTPNGRLYGTSIFEKKNGMSARNKKMFSDCLCHLYLCEVCTSEFVLEERPLRRIFKILCAILTAPC